MKTLARKHPLAIRWFHWLNFPLLALMIWSGILIYWANAVYRIGLGDWTLARMTVAQTTYRTLHINNRLGRGNGPALLLHVALPRQRSAVRRLHALLG
jgi:hypothetical protein